MLLLLSGYRRLRKFFKAEDGVAAVEMAMVAGPFLYVFLAIFEMGTMLYTEYTLQAAVQEAARLVRTGQTQSDAAMTNPDEFKKKVCRLASFVMKCTDKVTVYVNHWDTVADLTAANLDLTSIGMTSGGAPGPTVNSPGGAKCITVVAATYDWKFVLPWMDVYANTSDKKKRRLIGFTFFRNEPFTNSAVASCTGK
jgi:Flp pilus assembly protein TadG